MTQKELDEAEYAKHFATGEQMAWQERGSFIRSLPPHEITTVAERGFWDGYLPRSRMWAMRPKSQCHWPEEEQAA